MIEFVEYDANPLAPITHVNQVLGLYRVGSLLQVKFGLIVPGAQGTTPRCVERANLLWEIQDIVAANKTFSWAFEEWTRGGFIPDDGGGRRARTQ